MDTGSILGLSEVRSPFLVDLLDPVRRSSKAGGRAARVNAFSVLPMPAFDLQDDVDDDNLDEDDDLDEDDEDSDDEEDEDGEADDVETWQVAAQRANSTPLRHPAVKLGLRLTFPS